MELRHPVNNKRILNKVLCIDDYGAMVFKCQYTEKIVFAPESMFIGPCVPSVSGTYVCATDAMPAYKECRKMFEESEANCNTCKHLKRLPHPKVYGYMPGLCGITNMSIKFHPDDPMGMECWEAR